MPEMDGIDWRAVPPTRPDIKIMFITGFAAVALNADFRPQRRQGAVEAVPPARPRQRGAEIAAAA